MRMAGAAQLPAPRSPRPARLGRRGGQSNRRSAVPALGSQIRGAELGDSPLFPPPGPCSCRRTPGSLTVSQERQQRGQEQQGCRGHGAGGGRAPDRGCDGRAGSSAGLRRWGQSRVRPGKRERGRCHRRRRQRLTESAPRPAPGVGAGDRRAGWGRGRGRSGLP